MSAAGDQSAAAQHLPDVERRRCWSILQESGFLSLISSRYAKRPEKRWLCTRRSSFCWEKRVAVEALLLVMAPFRTEAVLTVLHRNDPPWPRLDSAVTRLPELHGLTRSATIRSLKVMAIDLRKSPDGWVLLNGWMNVICTCDETRSWSIAKSARTQWARMPLILKRNLKLLGGSLATVNPPVYAPTLTLTLVSTLTGWKTFLTTIPLAFCNFS